jgi:hypothetical protein
MKPAPPVISHFMMGLRTAGELLDDESHGPWRDKKELCQGTRRQDDLAAAA